MNTRVLTKSERTAVVQGVRYDDIDISSADFALANGEPFIVRNDNPEEVAAIKVRPAENDADAWKDVHIGPMCEFAVQVTKVKQQSGISNLKYIV